MPFTKRRSRNIYYEVLGQEDAPPLLLVMGMGFSSRGWDNLPEKLAKTFRVIVFDNPGTGRSSTPPPILRIRHMADDAAAVLDAAGVQKAFVFGISMGGMIAIELVLRHPERVRKLALGATYGGWLMSKKPSVAAFFDLLLGGALARKGEILRMGKILVSSKYLEDNRGRFMSWISKSEQVRPHIAAAQAVAISLHAAESRLKDLVVDTLVISGDCDRLVPLENSRRLAQKIPGAQFLVLAGAGHCFPLEQPEQTGRALMEFLLGGKGQALSLFQSSGERPF